MMHIGAWHKKRREAFSHPKDTELGHSDSHFHQPSPNSTSATASSTVAAEG